MGFEVFDSFFFCVDCVFDGCFCFRVDGVVVVIVVVDVIVDVTVTVDVIVVGVKCGR